MKEKRSIKLWAVAVWLLIWELAALALNQEIFLVSPVKAMVRFFVLAVTGDFWIGVLGSCARIALGFLLALLIGGILAVCSAKSDKVKDLFAPIMLAVKAVPVASFVILALICFSSKYLSVLISFMIVLPTIYENLFTGIGQTDRQLLEMAKVFKFSSGITRRYIVWPEVFPYLKSACRTAVGMAWKAGIAAEVIGTPKGSIGAKLYQAKIYLETPDLIAWTIGIVLLSLIMEKVIMWALDYVDVRLRGFGQRDVPLKVETGEDNHPGEVSVKVDNISKSFGEEEVLSNLSFEFPGGKVSGIMAPSGAGKTTLLRIISGLEEPDAGKIEFNARDESKTVSPGKGVKADISDYRTKCDDINLAIVFQEDRLLDYMTAEENIMLGNPKLTLGPVVAALEDVGIKNDLETEELNESKSVPDVKIDVEEKRVSEFSGGMRRRVAVLRALMAEWDVLILDEPFKGMDEGTRLSLINYIKSKASGRTVIMVTHDEEEIALMGVEELLTF